MEALNLLALNTTNCRIGSGAYGYSSELPKPGFDPAHPTAGHLWGCSNAQIFTEVSPEMHWEFALRHDIPWLERWGLVYYGCCEVLDTKMEILRRIPNLRKVSMNYRIHLDRAVRNVADQYVFSYKPNPAVFAGDTWHPDAARKELRRQFGIGVTRHQVEIVDRRRDDLAPVRRGGGHGPFHSCRGRRRFSRT